MRNNFGGVFLTARKTYHRHDRCAFFPRHDHPYVGAICFYEKTEKKIIKREVNSERKLTVFPHFSQRKRFSPM